MVTVRGPEERLLRKVIDAVHVVHDETGLEVACSLGLLNADQAARLADAGVRRYNHNLETCREVFPSICTTHTWDDRVATARLAIDAGMELCCGGILGMGETLEQRIDFAFELRDLDPCEVPINLLDPRPGTPLGEQPLLSPRAALQAIALFRLIMPSTILRLAGGREKVLGDLQAIGLLAGANALIVGNYLTTTGRLPEADHDLLEALGMPVADGPGEGRFVVDADGAHAPSGVPDDSRPRGVTRVQSPATGRVRWPVSLKLPSAAPPWGPDPTLVTDARSSRMRQLSSGPTPNAHVTAALIGETWLTATVIRADDSVASVSVQKLATRAWTASRFSPPGGVNNGSPSHSATASRGRSANGRWSHSP